MTAEVESSTQWKPKSNPWLIGATVALAAFMEVLSLQWTRIWIRKGPLPIEKMDDSKPHAELVAMLVIGLRVANYIKLVSQGYVPFSSTHRNM